MDQQYKQLLVNLDEFIHKFYWDKIIKGSLYLVGIIISFFLSIVFLEYFLFLNSDFKLLLISAFFVVALGSFSFFVLIPLARLTGLLTRMSHETAARLIGEHYPDINDKLLNTIQLYNLHCQVSSENIILLNASIEQRVLNFGVFRFKKIINLRLNKRYLKYALPPLTLFIVLLISSPTLIVKPAQRLVFFDSSFVSDAPFDFVLLNQKLQAEEGSDFKINLRLQGESIPADVSVLIDGFEYLMQKSSNVDFVFTLEKLHKPLSFRFLADKYYSVNYNLNVVNFPRIVDVDIEIKYPNYIGKPNETLSKISELIIPEGSSLLFKIKSKESDSLLIISDFNHFNYLNLSRPQYSQFQIAKVKTDRIIQLVPLNSVVRSKDTTEYQIIVVKDEFPQIKVSEFTDSVFEKKKFFKGLIKDDYGFSTLKIEFKYKNINENDTLVYLPISISTQPANQEFYNLFDFKTLDILPGTSVEYSFLVSDNDGVNGRKTTRSISFSYKQKTKEEAIEESEHRSENLSSEVNSTAKEAAKIAKKINEISEKIRGKKDLSWEEKKEIENLLKQFENLQEKMKEHIKQTEENLLKNQEELNEAEELKNKQEELKKLMEELLTPEMKQMMNELREMMEKNMDKEKIEEKLKEMKFDAEFMKEQLDRELEMMKQLKFEQKLQQNIEQLKALQKEQQKLSEEANKLDKKEAIEKQEQLNKEFDEFRKNMEEVRKENEELKEPQNLKETKELEQAIQKDMEESAQKLSEGKNSSGQKSQKEAAKKLEELTEQLESMQEEMANQSEGEDIENLKNILHNLLEISFNQEKLMEKVTHTSNRDPQFPGFIEEQKNIANDIAMVEDSLNKLALRNPSISPVVSRELKRIKAHSEMAFNDLKEMNTIGPTYNGQLNKSTGNQQFIMTSVNNLALILSEVLNQMQQQQMKAKSGKGSCKNPKPGQGGKGSVKTMRQMQEALQKQMEKMKQQMDKEGNNKNGKGKPGGMGEQMSEEMARMAAQQEALRKMLQEYRDQLLKQGNMKEAANLGEAARKMEQNETELVNKILTAESLKRQKEIVTRLLESEKAQLERDQNEERESNEGKNENNSNKNLILKYKEIYKEDLDLLKTIPPELKPFYKRLVNSYFSS